MEKSYKKALTIAGSDSSGGAGIQADVKTFSACGCYGMSIITAITAQNTCGVFDIHPIPTKTIEAQIQAVLNDIGVDAIKIGMLHSAEVIIAVAETLSHYDCPNIVIDPVMVATSGDRLIEEGAVDSLKKRLLPKATLITPNIPEAEILIDQSIKNQEEMEAAAGILHDQLGVAILLKGGHLGEEKLADVLHEKDADAPRLFSSKRVATRNTHGTGCTLSSAIASFLARGRPLYEAVNHAEQYLHKAVAEGARYTTGKGNGPVHHFHAFWQ